MTAYRSSALTHSSALLTLVLLAAVSTAESAALSGGHTEPSPSQGRPAHVGDYSPSEPYPFHRLVTSGGIRLYQKLISPARGASCPMHPHCSAYGQQAFQTRGPLRAFMMTADRLIRCGHDLEQYRSVMVDGFLRYSDPPADDSPAGNGGSAPSLGDKWPRLTTYEHDSALIFTDTDTPGPGQDLFRFAQQLALEGDFYRAITEYRRYLQYYPDSPYRSEAQLALLNCYFRAGQYSAAVEYGEKVLASGSDLAESEQMTFIVGKAGFESGDYDLAHRYFQRVTAGSETLSRMAILAQGLTYAYQYDWDNGAQTFALLGDDSNYGIKAQYCARLCREGQRLGRKNPRLAGVLAIVPGLGYLYDGYYQTALSALVVNGLFMWGAYEAFAQDHPSLGATLAVFGIGWYAGNIYGSVTSAERRNEKSRHDLLLKFDIGYEF